jgi:glucoamylase
MTRTLAVAILLFIGVRPLFAESNPCSELMASLAATPRNPAKLAAWAADQTDRSAKLLWKNLSPEGTAPGAVVASPSRQNPDYWYHWVRDASLSFEPVLTFYLSSTSPAHKAENYRRLLDFVRFSRANQYAPTKSGLGEPKFYVDGTPFNDQWGRPQNDSQALRATLFIRFAQGLLNEGKAREVRELLYSPSKESLIKKDLEDVARRWREPCYDLWEEVSGQHFFTLMVQRKSLVDGAALARRLGDAGAAEYYERQAREMVPYLLSHWNPEKGYIEATRHWREGIDYKFSGLDTSVILGAIKGDVGDGLFGVTDARVLATAHRMKQTFQDLYSVNKRGLWGTLIGRYPEDRYDGYETDGSPPGNPWPLLTVGFAELHYKAANAYRDRGEIPVTETSLAFFQSLVPTERGVQPGRTIRRGEPLFDTILERLRHEGDSYFLRAKYHGHRDWAMSEQINRDSGHMQGAPHLTWNYAAELTALFERRQ